MKKCLVSGFTKERDDETNFDKSKDGKRMEVVTGLSLRNMACGIPVTNVAARYSHSDPVEIILKKDGSNEQPIVINVVDWIHESTQDFWKAFGGLPFSILMRYEHLFKWTLISNWYPFTADQLNRAAHKINWLVLCQWFPFTGSLLKQCRKQMKANYGEGWRSWAEHNPTITKTLVLKFKKYLPWNSSVFVSRLVKIQSKSFFEKAHENIDWIEFDKQRPLQGDTICNDFVSLMKAQRIRSETQKVKLMKERMSQKQLPRCPCSVHHAKSQVKYKH